MVTRKSRAEIERMRRAGRVVAEVLALVEEELKPGVTTGHLDLESETFDLRELAHDVTERFREQAARGGTSVELNAPTPVVGRWDRLRPDRR